MKSFLAFAEKALFAFVLTSGLLLAGHRATSQDTLLLTPKQAEKIFLDNNLNLLAARYNIDANRALIQQAKSWDNPVLTTDQNIYDRAGGFFAHNKNAGQIYVQVSELIRTAGKRNKQVLLAQDNTTLSAEQFEDLLRTLRYSLINDLFEIDEQLKLRKIYSDEIGRFQFLVKGMDAQFRAGNISLKENMRIKALLFSAQNDVAAIDAAILPAETEVKLLLNRNDTTFICGNVQNFADRLAGMKLPQMSVLLDSALANRPDLQIAKTGLDYQSHNLSYQKALAKPDVTLGPEFDQHSSYAPDYVGLTASLPLNIVNRNKGNIRAAAVGIQQQQAVVDGVANRIKNEVQAACIRFRFYDALNSSEQTDFSESYATMFQRMLESYQQRQIGLPEFIDFTDSYKELRQKMLDRQHELVKAALDINYSVGTDIIHLN